MTRDQNQISDLVERAAQGDEQSFADLVIRYQDMAVGYAFSNLGDFHRAEDVAQEAFLNAFRDLRALRDPRAFGAWLRSIVWKHCDRQTRRASVRTDPMEAAQNASSGDPGPDETLERSDLA